MEAVLATSLTCPQSRTASACRLAPWLVAWGLLVVVQIVTPLWYATPDTCVYLSMARSFAGTGHFTNLGGENLIFPVGYPVVISPAFLLAASPFLVVTAIHALLAAAYLAGAYRWVCRFAPEAALPIALLAVGNVIVLALFRRPLSEVAFMAAMIWLVNALASLHPTQTGWKPLLAASTLLTFLALIRPTGILFAAGLAVQLLVAIHRRQISKVRAGFVLLAVSLPAVTALTAFLAYDRFASHGQTGWTNLDVLARSPSQPTSDLPSASVAAQCLEGLRIRISEVGRLTMPGMFNAYGRNGTWLDVNMLVYLPLFVLLWFGWWRLVRRWSDAFAWTLPLYIALHIYWPFNQSGRYFAPLLPLMFLCFYFGLQGLGQWRLRALQTLVVAHLAVALGHWAFIDRPRALADERRWPEVEALARTIAAEGGTVRVGPQLGGTQFMLCYLLDRPVAGTPATDAPAPGMRWWVIPSEEQPSTGYTEHLLAGPYRLLHHSGI